MCTQGPLIVTEELHSLSFESELHLNQSGLNVKLEVRHGCISIPALYSKGCLWAVTIDAVGVGSAVPRWQGHERLTAESTAH